MRQGLLSIPALFSAHGAAAGKVELRDYRGRKVALVQVGKGEFRVPQTLTPGVYFLVAGRHKVSLSYMP